MARRKEKMWEKMYSRRAPGSTIWLIHAELRMFPI